MFSLKYWMRALVVVSGLFGTHGAAGIDFSYNGEVFFCTATCDSFGALGGSTGGSSNSLNSLVTGSISIELEADGSFSLDSNDSAPFDFEISTTAIPFEEPVIGPSPSCPPPNEVGQLCNATTVNPLPLDNSVATVSGSGMVQDGIFTSGTLTFVFTVAPFSNNGGVIEFDLATGEAEGTVFGGAVVFLLTAGTFSMSADTDGDGVFDSGDNCINTVNVDQRDSNGDGFGNACDADLNNDCVVAAADLGLFRSLFFSADEDADFNGDGVVSTFDLGLMRKLFFAAPGPSGLDTACDD
ncbi:MAG: hypothetical protein AB8G17_09115 [Gammaproteobacteria bacterium]